LLSLSLSHFFHSLLFNTREKCVVAKRNVKEEKNGMKAKKQETFLLYEYNNKKWKKDTVNPQITTTYLQLSQF